MGHARLSPSGWRRWSVCGAAPDREAGYPDEESEAAKRGTRIHAVAEAALRGEAFEDPYQEGWQPDQEAQWMADSYCEYINNRRNELDPTALRVEEKVDPGAYINRKDCLGTADAMIVSQDILEVIDLKTGGHLVEADEGQIKLYALGALYQYLDRETGEVPFHTVRLTVFQPRRPSLEGPIERYVEVTPNDLFTWGTMEFESAAQLTDEGVAVPDEEACKFCKARHDCKERAEAMQKQTEILTQGGDEAFDVLMSSERIDSLSPEQLATFLEIAPLIEARIKDARERATSLATDGVQIPGYKLVRGQSSRRWSEDAETIVKKLQHSIKLKKGEIYEQKLRSPAQLQKLGLPVEKWQKIERYIIKPEGKLTLVPESDSRENALPPVAFPNLEKVRAKEEVTPEPAATDTALPDFLL